MCECLLIEQLKYDQTRTRPSICQCNSNIGCQLNQIIEEKNTLILLQWSKLSNVSVIILIYFNFDFIIIFPIS